MDDFNNKKVSWEELEQEEGADLWSEEMMQCHQRTI